MTDVTQLLPGGGRGQPQRQVVAGYVSTNKPAPVDFSSALYVILPQLDPSYNFGPCKWGAAQGSTLPAQGTEVLVCFDDENVPVVVWWEGSPGFAPTGAAGGDLTGSYPNPTIGSGKVTTAKIAAGAVTSNEIADATIATGDLSTGVLNNFLKLLASADLKWTKGSGTCTWSGASADSAQTTIAHGLGHTPVAQGFCPTGTNALQYSLFSKDATNIVVTGRDTRNTALTGTFGFDWWAIG